MKKVYEIITKTIFFSTFIYLNSQISCFEYHWVPYEVQKKFKLMFKIQVHSLLSISISQSMHSSKIIGIQFYHLKLMCIPQEQYMKMNLLVKSTVFRQDCTKYKQAPGYNSNNLNCPWINVHNCFCFLYKMCTNG